MFALYVLIMAVVTYLIRMLPFTLVRKKITNTYIKSFLLYVPYAVLGSMTVPAVFYSTGNIYTSISGFLVAIFLSFMNKSLLTVAIASCIISYLVGYVTM